MRVLVKVAICVAATIVIDGASAALPTVRLVLGNPPEISLRERADAESGHLDALIKQTAAKGAIQVLVGLRVGFAPEGQLAPADALQQRDEIAAAQSAVLAHVISIGNPEKDVKRYQFIPFLALKANTAELEALGNLVEVTSISEDVAVPPSLDSSVPLIGGPAAWSAGYTGAGQTVAILDTGVDKTHPFLAGKVVSEACYSSNLCPGGATQTTAIGSGVPCPDTVDGCSHGTHVAGIAAGKGSSFSGVAKDASLIAIQVFHSYTDSPGATLCSDNNLASPCALATTSDYILGLERVYAIRSSFSIASVNLSLGGGKYTSNCDGADTQTAATKAAIDNLRAANIATVIASGNNGYFDAIARPGCISTAISVGRSAGSFGFEYVSSSSNSATFLHLLAPGSSINSSVPGGGFDLMSGTSMAAPHVAGAWALLKQKSLSLSVSDALAALTATGAEIRDGRNAIVTPRIQVDEALNVLSAYSPLARLASCSGHGSLEQIYAWGPEAESCWGLAAWGSFNLSARSLPTTMCKCTGQGGLEGLSLWGPSGATCAGIAGWGTYSSGCVDLAAKPVCGCAGHGQYLEGMTLWGPAGAACAGIASWGQYDQSCRTVPTVGTLPAAPEIGAVTAGNASLFVSFTPGAPGSGVLSAYTADCGGITGISARSPIVVKGVTPGASYTCKVKTSTTVGDSAWSTASNVATTPARLASCTGHGGVEGVRTWGPDASPCWGVASWGNFKQDPRTLPSRVCKCTGHGGIEGVALWGPEGEACAGIPAWGTHNAECVDVAATSMCGCVGHGGVEGLTLWGPSGAACGGIAAWGAHNQACYAIIRLPDARYPMDIDGSGAYARYGVGTDGMLLLRYLFGVRGNALTNDSLHYSAERDTPELVAAYLAQIRTALDVDRNGHTDALADGLLILRYMLGLRGTALVQNAIGSGATRSAAVQIENYIRTLIP